MSPMLKPGITRTSRIRSRNKNASCILNWIVPPQQPVQPIGLFTTLALAFTRLPPLVKAVAKVPADHPMIKEMLRTATATTSVPPITIVAGITWQNVLMAAHAVPRAMDCLVTNGTLMER